MHGTNLRQRPVRAPRRYRLVALNRQERSNALGGTLREDIVDAMATAEVDDSVRAIVMTGAGRAFCAGGDLNEIYTRATQG
ncbi:enoyl-CoA hydratase/isomerase family protein [Burkholderia multivorans]|nr:enoyl-CoA hydratase/isomerase family protein [Burkholderia multivorans]